MSSLEKDSEIHRSIKMDVYVKVRNEKVGSQTAYGTNTIIDYSEEHESVGVEIIDAIDIKVDGKSIITKEILPDKEELIKKEITPFERIMEDLTFPKGIDGEHEIEGARKVYRWFKNHFNKGMN